jgi:hypothetical protein
MLLPQYKPRALRLGIGAALCAAAIFAAPAHGDAQTAAREQKPSEWIKAQPAFLGAQGKTVLDPDFDIDDGGLPHEKPILPVK